MRYLPYMYFSQHVIDQARLFTLLCRDRRRAQPELVIKYYAILKLSYKPVKCDIGIYSKYKLSNVDGRTQSINLKILMSCSQHLLNLMYIALAFLVSNDI